MHKINICSARPFLCTYNHKCAVWKALTDSRHLAYDGLSFSLLLLPPPPIPITLSRYYFGNSPHVQPLALQVVFKLTSRTAGSNYFAACCVVRSLVWSVFLCVLLISGNATQVFCFVFTPSVETPCISCSVTRCVQWDVGSPVLCVCVCVCVLSMFLYFYMHCALPAPVRNKLLLKFS
jgi:hypothetical protein